MSLRRSSVTIKRTIKDLNLAVPINCLVGAITILRDEDGALIKEHQDILTSEYSVGASEIECEGKVIALKDRALLGFESFVEDHPSIGSFLLASGFHEDECEEIIRRYDLEDQAYLPIRLLPPTAQRQLQLIVLMRSAPALIVLNDPFMPFNGRWREAFAELLLEHVRKTSATVVVVHLSFRPKAWLEKPEVREIDLGRENEKALQRHFAITINEEKKVEQPAPERSRASTQKEDLAPLQEASPKRLWINKWGNALVNGVAGVSSAVRTLHGAVAFFGIAAVMATIGYASYPEAAKAWGKMKALSATFTYESPAPVRDDLPATPMELASSEEEQESNYVNAVEEVSIGEQLDSAEPMPVVSVAVLEHRTDSPAVVGRNSVAGQQVLDDVQMLIAAEWLNDGLYSSEVDSVEATSQMCRVNR